ncbi:MAG: Fic family protein [Bacteroidetes bacterium]|nr:MAG: Fic family protein [Bacteroidota bacterium]
MRTGTYRDQLQGVARYKSFIPNKLPFQVKMDGKLQSLLSRADMALGRLDSVAEFLPAIDFFIFMYVRKEATISSQIEGTQATFVDVLKKEAKIEDGETHKDVDEIINYINAMTYGLKRLTEFPLSLRLIKEIHSQLLSGVRGEYRTPGEFRTSQNWIGGPTIETAIFVPPPASEVISLMGDLEEYMHSLLSTPVLIKIGLIHAQFETIHPFLDGNGRIGRLLITFYLCQQKILHKPLLYLSDYFKANRQTYYDRLNNYRTKDAIENWLEFFLQGIIETSQKAVETARKIISLREHGLKTISKFGRSTEKALMIYDHLFLSSLLKVKDVEKITNLTNPAALSLVDKFEKSGILRELTGFKRNRVFSFADYIALFV